MPAGRMSGRPRTQGITASGHRGGMSESDSFIDEVTEAVRRDRLFALFRRYGWIAILIVLLIVGAAAWNEYRKARAVAAAQGFGDALIAALDAGEPADRLAALEAVDAPATAGPLMALMEAAAHSEADDPEQAAALLRPLAQSTEAPAAYSDLAALKLVLLGDAGEDATTRAQLLERLSVPGAPYRILALEQQAIALAAAGETDAARTAAESLMREPDLTQGVAQRVSQLLIALGPEADAAGAPSADAGAGAGDAGTSDTGAGAADPNAGDAPSTTPDAATGADAAEGGEGEGQ